MAERSVLTSAGPGEEVEGLKKRLRALRISHAALINSLDLGLAVIGPEGNIREVNTYALNALGLEETEMLGKRFSQAIVAVNDQGHVIDPLRRPITEAFIEGRAVTEYTNLRRKDGTSMPVALTASPIIIDGKPAGAIDAFRDLTKERQLDLAKNDFVSLASHQLRTPATGVKAILHMLSDGDFGPLSKTQRKYLQRAIDTNDRQLNIIEDLLDVARADAGVLELNLDVVDVSALIRAVVSEHLQTIVGEGLKLEVGPLLHLSTLGDAPKLEMVFDNLLNNAIKYTPSGGRIRICVEQSESTIHVRVEDTGIGIAEKDMAAIFDKFGRVRDDSSSSGDGTGLGLYLARQVIDLHNGDISVTSEPGRGSTFRVSIPKLRKELRKNV